MFARTVVLYVFRFAIFTRLLSSASSNDAFILKLKTLATFAYRFQEAQQVYVLMKSSSH